MERKASLTPYNHIPHIRTLHYDFRPDSFLCPRHGGSGGKLSVIKSHGKSRMSTIPILDMILISSR